MPPRQKKKRERRSHHQPQGGFKVIVVCTCLCLFFWFVLNFCNITKGTGAKGEEEGKKNFFFKLFPNGPIHMYFLRVLNRMNKLTWIFFINSRPVLCLRFGLHKALPTNVKKRISRRVLHKSLRWESQKA